MIENRGVCVTKTNICISVKYISITVLCVSFRDIYNSKNYRYLYLLKEISVFEMGMSLLLNG